MIRSFTYMVVPYMPQPRAQPNPNQAQQKQAIDPAMMGGGGGGGRGGGGRGGRGGGGGGGMMGMDEKPGATRIIMILPEGTRVVKDQLVCELDSAAFRDELQAQEIRWAKAKSAVEQVQSTLDVNEITLKEYRDGILPQDTQLIRQYVQTCRVDAERAKKNLDWAKETAAKGFRTATQVQADALAYQQASIALEEALGMANRLDKFTGPKLLKNLEAKLAAIRADKLAQESVFELESTRKRKLETMIQNCVLRAPRDGIVVYANQANLWGMVQTQIQEGVTVREGQAIINLPDPKNMRVRAKVNESKVSHIRPGQPARIIVDAFPDRMLSGTVAEVTPIPAPSAGPMSDVRIYYATVNIDSGGFDELRPGLSAEVTFLVDAPRTVVRVPLQAVRWVDTKPYAAVAEVKPGNAEKPSWQWRSLTLGETDKGFAEVISGLKPGERVVSRPEALPAPVPVRLAHAAE
jgi:multidrug resistance efflux pump